MLRILSSLLIVSFLVHSATAQESKGTLKISEVPELRGFRLGMPLKHIQRDLKDISIIDTLSPRANGFGLSETAFFIRPSSDKDKRFDGVMRIELGFWMRRCSLF
jgi:hypothetical protein